MPLPAQQIAFQEYVSAISEAAARVERLTKQMLELLPGWRWTPVVEALQVLRGVAQLTAIITVAEIGDIARFSSARQLMSYLGLTPSEYSTGKRRRLGEITKRATHTSAACWSRAVVLMRIRCAWLPFCRSVRRNSRKRFAK
jgi:transposase